MRVSGAAALASKLLSQFSCDAALLVLPLLSTTTRPHCTSCSQRGFLLDLTQLLQALSCHLELDLHPGLAHLLFPTMLHSQQLDSILQSKKSAGEVIFHNLHSGEFKNSFVQLSEPDRLPVVQQPSALWLCFQFFGTERCPLVRTFLSTVC